MNSIFTKHVRCFAAGLRAPVDTNTAYQFRMRLWWIYQAASVALLSERVP